MVFRKDAKGGRNDDHSLQVDERALSTSGAPSIAFNLNERLWDRTECSYNKAKARRYPVYCAGSKTRASVGFAYGLSLVEFECESPSNLDGLTLIRRFPKLPVLRRFYRSVTQ